MSRPVALPTLSFVSTLQLNHVDNLTECAVVVFYVVGYIVIASANGVGALAAGIILYAMYVSSWNALNGPC